MKRVGQPVYEHINVYGRERGSERERGEKRSKRLRERDI